MQHILFVDLDGVLVDLTRGLSEILGIDMSKVSKKEYTRLFKEFIKDVPFKKRIEFWSNLPPMPDYKDLWNNLEKYQPLILSSVSGCMAACEGKKIWCKKYLGLDADRVFCSKDSKEKQNYASPKAILIDDFDDNIEQFRAKGGHGIFFKNNKDALKKIKKIIES